MRLASSKIVTGLLFGAATQLAVATTLSDLLIGVGTNEAQDAMGFVVGQICPGGVSPRLGGTGSLDSQDLSDRCTEAVIAGLSANASQEADAANMLQAAANEENAAIATTQGDARGANDAHGESIGARQTTIRTGGAPTVYMNNSGFNWSTGAAGDGESRWGFFVNGLYVNSDRDSTSRESGFDADDWGVTGGIDYAFSDKLVFGVAVGYKDSDADIDANGGDLETESTSYFAYWSLYPDDRWYVDAMVGYTDNDHDQNRNINYSIAGFGPAAGTTTTVNNTAVSDTESDEFSVSVTAGRNYYHDTWTLSPYGRIDYADIEIDGFSESMALSALTDPGSGLALQIDD